MPMCKFCGKPFAWGNSDGSWVPLIPVGEEGEVPRTFQDEHGILRADHRALCQHRGGATVRISKLAVPVKAGEIIGRPGEVIDPDSGEILFKEKR